MICMMLVLIVTMSVSVFATSGSFIESPSNNQGPTLVEGKNEDEDCISQLIITPFGDRDNLSDEERKELEDAYDTIKNTDDLSDLCDAIEDLAEKLGTSTGNISVSDLFHIGNTDCDSHDEHGAFDIKLQADTLKNFAGLMYYSDGKWEMVDGAKVQGEHLIFKSDKMGPYAILVNAAAGGVGAPDTGDSMPWVYIALMAVSAIGLAVVIVNYKKKSA